LPDDIYTQVLDLIVIACADILVMCSGKYMLCKRNIYPQKDWWVIGGRMRPGESPREAACRNFERETGLEIIIERFKFLGVYSTTFAMRQLPPQENGTHTLK
jgi:ADP-ribose pyrophosphatase YjhB (NUDIX family)